MYSRLTFTGIVAAMIIFGRGMPSAADASPSVDACSLLTPVRVSAVLGITSQPGRHLYQTSTLTCGWSESSSTTPSAKRVVLEVYGTIGSLTPADRFANAKAPIKGVVKTPVSGIGDDAVYVTTPGFGTGLIVKKGDSVFNIRVYGFALDQIMAMEKTLAQDVLAKL